MGILNIIHFFPDDLKLIKESPVDRRKFMDIDICQNSALAKASKISSFLRRVFIVRYIFLL